jgi:uncharacterized damage-inducible protein DinB
MNPTYARENESERQRLSRITARLTAEDFSRPVRQGWTVATKLIHLAFWDMYYLACIEGWERTGFVASRVTVDAINETVRALSRTIPNESVVQLVRHAAEAIERKVESLSPELASAIDAGGYTRILHRALHRREHLDQIEQALK